GGLTCRGVVGATADAGSHATRPVVLPSADTGGESACGTVSPTADAGEIEVGGVPVPDDDAAPARVVVLAADDQVMRAALVAHRPDAARGIAFLFVRDGSRGRDIEADGALGPASTSLVVADQQVAGAVRRPGLSETVDELQVRTGDANRGLAVHGFERQVG